MVKLRGVANEDTRLVIDAILHLTTAHAMVLKASRINNDPALRDTLGKISRGTDALNRYLAKSQE